MAKIVLCDDSKTTTLGLKMKLEKAGHEIAGTAADGEEGLTLYLQLRPDLILLDITMPNKDGKECLESIMKHDSNAQIVMISGVQEQATIQQCLQLGAKGYFVKEKLFDDDYFNSEILPTIEKLVS